MTQFPNKEIVRMQKERYKKGCRVELVNMADPHTSLSPGELGTVDMVDDIGTVFVNWDNGSTLGIAYGEDSIKLLPSPVDEKITEQILAVRDTGKTNMFDTNAVQRIASDMGFHELVIFIEENKSAYAKFILTGK